MIDATPIQSFAAGAALCSTSLGTTFTVLSTSGLASTRLGSVLATAAMMDDVVGLVMVQVVSSLGSREEKLSAATTVRPVLVSAAFAVALPLACRYVLRPAMAYLARLHIGNSTVKSLLPLQRRQLTFVIHTCLLLALVVGASFAGTSVFLAAYLAGIVVAWWDTEYAEPGPTVTNNAPTREITGAEATTRTTTSQEPEPGGRVDKAPESNPELGKVGCDEAGSTGLAVYECYYSQAVERVLKPFFFVGYPFVMCLISKLTRGGRHPSVSRFRYPRCLGVLFCGVALSTQSS